MEKLVMAYGLTFEDYTEKDEDGNWSYICKHHAMNVPYGSLDEAGESDCLCGVLDCQHTSDFYVDFVEEELEPTNQAQSYEELLAELYSILNRGITGAPVPVHLQVFFSCEEDYLSYIQELIDSLEEQ